MRTGSVFSPGSRSIVRTVRGPSGAPHLAEVREPIVRSTLGAINAGDPPKVTDSDLPRKEVIQPHLPVRLPCYDFVPITNPTFDGCPPCGLAHRLRVLPAFMT